ncbi:YdeI/OmpD-associated family protein [Ornithinimicrobium cryptoxanthini]|uniref:YdeI/OmpD-associated family protein n=1 Tax=Ornithinimicrobium cryptoxanthini TaxID=2934161 RepID=A0ABY4YIC4_9MICO|nr:YdeI/OmpD-associated family protein [Ornithinimicrobium cryptoxanthini]USQ76010.1 YdeI/OmpD-associated family protein [Ornithinimicrobium cryptoxanthini]
MTTAFDGQVQQIGDRLIVRVPEDVSSALPSRGQVAVEAQVNGRAWATVVEPDGRKGHWLAVDEQLQTALSLSDGDTVDVELEPTRAWPEPDLPEDFEAALTDASDLAEPWDSITPMARWEWVRWVSATRNPQTRERRIEVSVDKLRNGSRRPCCFDLSSCTDPELSKSGKLVDTVDQP